MRRGARMLKSEMIKFQRRDSSLGHIHSRVYEEEYVRSHNNIYVHNTEAGVKVGETPFRKCGKHSII